MLNHPARAASAARVQRLVKARFPHGSLVACAPGQPLRNIGRREEPVDPVGGFRRADAADRREDDCHKGTAEIDATG